MGLRWEFGWFQLDIIPNQNRENTQVLLIRNSIYSTACLIFWRRPKLGIKSLLKLIILIGFFAGFRHLELHIITHILSLLFFSSSSTTYWYVHIPTSVEMFISSDERKQKIRQWSFLFWCFVLLVFFSFLSRYPWQLFEYL